MPLLISDAEVEALADELAKVTRASSTTEALRIALRAQLAKSQGRASIRERLARSKALAREIGPKDPNVDLKAYMDEMWGDA